MPLVSSSPSLGQVSEKSSSGVGGQFSAASGTAGDETTAAKCDGATELTFDSVYRTYASFVWRSACRLGVPRCAAEDVMQEVFMVVYRRLATFEEGTSMRAWLSAIIVHVVRTYRRTLRRKHPTGQTGVTLLEPDKMSDGAARNPLEEAERDEAVQRLHAILGQMQDERREVFVLSELAQLSAPEIAQALQLNINTVYWRLRTARREFEKIMFRDQAARARSHT